MNLILLFLVVLVFDRPPVRGGLSPIEREELLQDGSDREKRWSLGVLSRNPGSGIPCHFDRYFYPGISFQSREIPGNNIALFMHYI